MKKYLTCYIKENSKMITIFTICLSLGIISGIIFYNFAKIEVREELKNVVQSTLDISKSENFAGVNVITNGIRVNLVLVILLYFTSIIMICPIFISAINYLKGLSIGIYIPIIFSIFSARDAVVALLLNIILPNLFFLPAFIFLSTNALNMHYIMINQKKESKIKLILANVSSIIIGISFIFASILIEQIFAGTIISIYKGI